MIALGADLRTDLPKYRIYEQGVLLREVEEVKDFFHEDMVSFLLGAASPLKVPCSLLAFL